MAASTPTSDWIAPVARRLSTPAEAYAFSTRRVTSLLNRRLQRLRSHGRLAAGGCSAPAPAQRKQGKARERGAVDGVRTQRAVPLEKGDQAHRDQRGGEGSACASPHRAADSGRQL